MNKKEIITFFDNCAPTWDQRMIRKEDIIKLILDNAKITAGEDILDVACGTGVLIPDYLNRKVGSATGIDISPRMIEIAKKKYQHPNIQLMCSDIETTTLPKKFDCIVVYNSFPHFPNPERLISLLSSHLKKGGRLTIAHSMNRERLIQHHSGAARNISIDLPSIEDLAAIFKKYLFLEIAISDDQMYQVVGKNI